MALITNFNAMALYRNIAGVGVGYLAPISEDYAPGGYSDAPIYTIQSSGSSYLVPPTSYPVLPMAPPLTGGFIPQTTTQLPSYLNPFEDPVLAQQQRDTAAAAYDADMRSRYSWLMEHPYSEIAASGYYVYPDGSIFQWTDPNRTRSVAYLSLDWIQQIENDAGTAGSLLLHMQEPLIAKDTAGYGGGSSQSSGSGTVYSAPIPEIQDLPPLVPTVDGGVTFDPNAVQTDTPLPVPSATPAPLPTSTTPAQAVATVKDNLVPLAVLAGLLFVAVTGDRVVKKRNKLVYAGGVGTLFYLIAKKN